jgi:hypothetical protein
MVVCLVPKGSNLSKGLKVVKHSWITANLLGWMVETLKCKLMLAYKGWCDKYDNLCLLDRGISSFFGG